MKVCERCRNSSLRRSRFLVLGQDVDVPAGQLRGQPDVLPAPADGEAELVVGNDDLDAVRFLVEHDLGHLGRRQRVDDEGRGVAATTG